MAIIDEQHSCVYCAFACDCGSIIDEGEPCYGCVDCDVDEVISLDELEVEEWYEDDEEEDS